MLFDGDVDALAIYTWWIGWLFDQEGRLSLSVNLDGLLVASSSSLGEGSMAMMAAVMPRLPMGFAGVDALKSIDGLVLC